MKIQQLDLTVCDLVADCHDDSKIAKDNCLMRCGKRNREKSAK
jgi:hypothetical protein